MPNPRPYKRQLRNLLIHRPLQREYTLLMLAVMMVVCLVVSFVIHTTMKQAFLGSPYKIGRVSPYEVLSDVNNLLVVRVSLTMLMSVLVATLIGIVFLHRVAGPVYRFRMTLKRMAGGEIPEDMRLRDRDYFKEVATEFNNVFKYLRGKRNSMAEMADNLEKLSASGDIKDPARNELQDMAQSLKKW
ncbi:MAG TPA: hypothetical protein PKL97_09890 [Candidatus Omnitrophota bacterium]|nr:hypothetical protein [Candidatus Omnitrophota bacterium]